MSKINLSDIFSDLNTESSVILPKSIKIKNIKDLDTITDATSSFMPQKGGYSDATSSFMLQKGGNFIDSNKDINQLLSMLSATSHDNYTTNSTDTEQLKNKLFNIIQSGGASDNPFHNWDRGEPIPTNNIDVPLGPRWENNLNFSEDILAHLLVPILNIINDTEYKKWYIIFLYNTFIQYPLIKQFQFMQAINKYLYYYNYYTELSPKELYVQNILKMIVYTYYTGTGTGIPMKFSTVFNPVLTPPNNNIYPKLLLTNNIVEGYLSHNPLTLPLLMQQIH
jgi:hypothetical protein